MGPWRRGKVICLFTYVLGTSDMAGTMDKTGGGGGEDNRVRSLKEIRIKYLISNYLDIF